MRTRSSLNLPGESSPNPTSSNPKHRNRRRSKQPFILEESPVDTMADQRTLAELLRAPTKVYADAIVVPPILAEHFELKHSLINMMTSDQFFELEKDNPHDHIRWFNKITSTIKYKDAWDRYKDLLRACPHHGFTKLHQLDTFYNALNMADQDSLNSAAGGNLLERRTQDVLTIIENKSKIAKLTHAVNQQTSVVTTAITAILKQFQATLPPASIKAVVEICVTCGGAIRTISVSPPMVTLSRNFEIIFKDTFQQPRLTTIRNMMASFFQMNTASTSSSGPLLSNTIANPKGELKAITTLSGIVFDGPSVHMPPPFINSEEDERVEETLTDPNLGEFTIKVLPPLVQKAKPPSQRNYVVHQRDPLHPNFLYPLRMHKQKQQDKDEIQIHKFWQMFKQLHINITLANALILILKYQKMLKALLSIKEKLLKLANTPLNENCSAVILKKLPEKLGDPRKFLIPCGFSELKCKALADLVLVGKFTFVADFVIVDYESDPRVLLILGRPFLLTARAFIDVHGEDMILRDDDERLTLNMRHDTSSYSNQPQKESINMINIYDDSCEDYHKDLFATNHLSGNPTFSSQTDLTSSEVKDGIFDPEGYIVLIEKFLNLDFTKDFLPPHNINPLSGSTTSSSPDHLLKEFADELTLITFPLGNDDLPFDIESDLREIEYFLNHDPIKEMDSVLEDLIDESNLDEPNDNLFDTIPDMFTDEHALDIYPFRFFFEVDALPSTDNEDKVFNSGILIQENLSEVTFQETLDKNEKKIAISHASLILEDFDPPLHELTFHKEVPWPETLLSFSSENEEKVFKPGILTSKRVHTSLLPELSHRGPKVFKVIKIFESPMEILPCSFREDIRILDVPYLHFYPP
uniref:Reverse transcriptase domain-containing protein n=1 Tax=Tanacetum cinerariifolium TaxID=118510 RepID=A0A6L2JSK9_TANCI|nr:reverse transcriptase domain-containing protein [Tanacetum cinerariifolium]